MGGIRSWVPLSSISSSSSSSSNGGNNNNQECETDARWPVVAQASSLFLPRYDRCTHQSMQKQKQQSPSQRHRWARAAAVMFVAALFAVATSPLLVAITRPPPTGTSATTTPMTGDHRTEVVTAYSSDRTQRPEQQQQQHHHQHQRREAKLTTKLGSALEQQQQLPGARSRRTPLVMHDKLTSDANIQEMQQQQEDVDSQVALASAGSADPHYQLTEPLSLSISSQPIDFYDDYESLAVMSFAVPAGLASAIIFIDLSDSSNPTFCQSTVQLWMRRGALPIPAPAYGGLYDKEWIIQPRGVLTIQLDSPAPGEYFFAATLPTGDLQTGSDSNSHSCSYGATVSFTRLSLASITTVTPSGSASATFSTTAAAVTTATSVFRFLPSDAAWGASMNISVSSTVTGPVCTSPANLTVSLFSPTQPGLPDAVSGANLYDSRTCQLARLGPNGALLGVQCNVADLALTDFTYAYSYVRVTIQGACTGESFTADLQIGSLACSSSLLTGPGCLSQVVPLSPFDFPWATYGTFFLPSRTVVVVPDVMTLLPLNNQLALPTLNFQVAGSLLYQNAALAAPYKVYLRTGVPPTSTAYDSVFELTSVGGTFDMPFVVAGMTYIGVFLNSSDSPPLSSTVTYQIQVSPVDCLQSCSHGTCTLDTFGASLVSYCSCNRPYSGWSCDEIDDYSAYIGYMFFLTVSNLAFLPAIIVSIRRKLWTECVVYTFTMFGSAFYHICDSNISLCMYPYDAMGVADFYGSYVSFWFTFIYLARLVSPWKHVLQIMGMLGLLIGVTVDRFSAINLAVLAAVGVALIVFTWVRMCRAAHVRWIKYFIWWRLAVGLAIAIVGLCIFGFVQTDSNYGWTHSLWHICIMSSVFFLLISLYEPPDLAVQVDEMRRRSVHTQVKPEEEQSQL
ncbi:hypothetical protein CAOG_000999 [Capsaspora owczarzaki ATCC 30864]|uniref:EGF-like domain-containing protein n=2 Tax=Capsaspora owczarzaki (strain ATCC 30864) TaxID=595528 RepID=A0A0D2U2Z4_CAPO3|nr:hypothetical protein CAOG_000999 [Capsaspora owczarzaki ATCC 30864]